MYKREVFLGGPPKKHLLLGGPLIVLFYLVDLHMMVAIYFLTWVDCMHWGRALLTVIWAGDRLQNNVNCSGIECFP